MVSAHICYQALRVAMTETGTTRDAELIELVKTVKPFRWILHEDNFPTKEVAALFAEATETSIKDYVVAEIPWGPPGQAGKKYLV